MYSFKSPSQYQNLTHGMMLRLWEKHTLGDKMKRLSKKAKLSRIYTNHCWRATSITLLDGYKARHVMVISGHKSESSIRSYARNSLDQKAKMTLTLAEAVAGNIADIIVTKLVLPHMAQNRTRMQRA